DVVQSLYLVDVATGKSRQLTRDRAMNGSPRWAPDGKRLLYLVSFWPDREYRFHSALNVLTVADGASRVVVETSWGGVSGAEWITDARIAFIGVHAGARALPVKADLWTVSADGGEPECRTAGVVPGVSHSVQTDLPIGELGEGKIRIVGDRAYVK